jgi:hypothetical protein
MCEPRKKDLIVLPDAPLNPRIPEFWEPSGVTQPAFKHACMFDGLPPGVYGLVCNCPRCSPSCVSSSSG